MKLQTKVEIPVSPFCIDLKNRIAVVGSCFAENIGSRLSLINSDEIRVFSNPSGVVYNPLSVAMAVENLQSGRHFDESELVEHGGLWHSMEHHGRFSAATKEEVLSKINREAVKSLDVLIITLGTAFTYFYNGKPVANCHKIPDKEFLRRRLSVAEVVESLERIAAAYPMAKLVVTLSPIRHLRDGLAENSLSKATLRVGIDDFCAKNPDSRSYFPSYEIMMDELRDYRFTGEDMCHPTEQARGYIWELFRDGYLSKEFIVAVEVGERKARREAHRPLRG